MFQAKYKQKIKHARQLRLKRHRRVRGKVYGTASRPRLSVFRSNRHIYAQVIDDERGHTLVAASDLTLNLAKSPVKPGKIELARAVGEQLGKLAQEVGISKVVFDRGGYKYHGRVKALAEGAREAGLNF